MNNKLTRRRFGYLAIAGTTISSLAYLTNKAVAQWPYEFPYRQTRSFVYVIANNTIGENTIAAYARNPRTGRLFYLDSYPTGGSGSINALGVSQSSLVTDGQYLYAVNPGSANISVLAIRQDGSLQLIGSPVASGGLFPVSLALSRKVLYVANVGTPSNYTGFIVNNGSLQPLEGSTVNLNPADQLGLVLFNSTGDVLIGTRIGSSIIDSFQVDSNGRLIRASLLENQAGAFGGAFRPGSDSVLLVNLSGLPGNATYLVNEQGNLNQVNAVNEPTSQNPCWAVFRPDGAVAWVSNLLPSSISLYAVNSNGGLTRLSTHSTHKVGCGSADLAIDKAGRYMYQLLSISKEINVLRLTNSSIDGGLAQVATIGLPEISAPIGLVVVDL
ncbi:lactonase family protein [Nostoc sp. CHAB 5844]|nr:lactonase family protein [Nostoc sp. CHAB 5844]